MRPLSWITQICRVVSKDLRLGQELGSLQHQQPEGQTTYSTLLPTPEQHRVANDAKELNLSTRLQGCYLPNEPPSLFPV